MEFKPLWRILVIDDDEEDFLQTQTMLCKAHNHEVVLDWAPTFETGESLLNTTLYDAVLVDYDPGSSEVIDFINTSPAHSTSTPFILYPEQASQEIDEQALQAGDTPYITKTEANPHLLERIIRYAIERKQMEEELQRKHQTYQAFALANVQVAVFATDENLVITVWNQGAERLYGWTESEAVGQVAGELLRTRVSVQQIAEFIRQIEENNLFVSEVVQYTKDNRRIIVEGRVTPIRDQNGELTGFVTSNLDITERVEAEARLREALNALKENDWHLQMAHEAAQLGSWNWKAGDSAAICSDTFFRLHGIEPPADHRFELEEYLSTIHPDDSERVSGITLQAIQGVPYGEIEDNEFRIIKPDGTHSWMAAYQRAIYDGDTLLGITGVTMDITARKQFEDALQQYAQQLERSNRDLEEFAFVASHDLQEPMRKIKMFCDLLISQASTTLNGVEREYLQRMRISAERLMVMLSDLLSYSRISTRSENRVPVDLNQVLEEVISDLEISINKNHATIEAGRLPVIEGEPTQLRQMLQNLISNAVKFHPPGAAARVKVSAVLADNDHVEIKVEDNGIGFDEALADQIFQPFQRLVNRSEYSGTGIGLAVCRKIVERHGGKISVRSKPGAGTTFTVLLPLKQEHGR